jgi:carbon monoxide dehydrogenase subunit G
MVRTRDEKRVVAVALCAVLVGCARASEAPALHPEPVEASNPSAAGAPSNASENADALGGESTTDIDAPSYAIMDALCRPEAMWHVLPHVANVESLGEDAGEHVWRVTHSLGIFRGGYVLRVRPVWGDDGHQTLGFRVDKRYARDVEDAWGQFRLEPVGPNRTRLHYRVRAVLFPGLIRWLFTQKIQWSLMVVPERVQGFIERQRGGERASSVVLEKPGDHG